MKDYMAEFFDAYNVPRTTSQNKSEVYGLCLELIFEEQNERKKAQAALDVTAPGSDMWWPALAHWSKEMADTEYVMLYTAYAGYLKVEPLAWPIPGAVWSLDDAVQDVLMDVSVLTQRTIDQMRLSMLCGSIGSVLYVLRHTALSYGISGQTYAQIFDLVHRSNLAKTWPDGQIHRNEHGKVLKPPGYVGPEPEIERILRDSVTPGRVAA